MCCVCTWCAMCYVLCAWWLTAGIINDDHCSLSLYRVIGGVDSRHERHLTGDYAGAQTARHLRSLTGNTSAHASLFTLATMLSNIQFRLNFHTTVSSRFALRPPVRWIQELKFGATPRASPSSSPYPPFSFSSTPLFCPPVFFSHPSFHAFLPLFSLLPAFSLPRSIELKTRSCNELTFGLYRAPFSVLLPSAGKPNRRTGTSFSIRLEQFGAHQQGISTIKTINTGKTTTLNCTHKRCNGLKMALRSELVAWRGFSLYGPWCKSTVWLTDWLSDWWTMK